MAAIAQQARVLHYEQMRSTITVRLSEDLAEWLENAASQAGVSQGRIIRDQLQKARELEDRPFLRLAGKISGPTDLSLRKGFSTAKASSTSQPNGRK